MNKQILFSLSLAVLLYASCSETKPEQQANTAESHETTVDSVEILNHIVQAETIPKGNLPAWVLQSNLIKEQVLHHHYQIEDRLNHPFLEEDFNGDGHLDIVLPIVEIKSKKKGFAIIHGKTLEVFILGAGKLFKNALGDNQDYINVWKINKNKENEPGVEEESGNGKNGILILENPSVEIEASEVGGGQIYWDGKEYAYFHQTC